MSTRLDERFVSVKEAARQTGQSEAKVRAAIQHGKIRVERVGYNILIPRSELGKLQPARAAEN